MTTDPQSSEEQESLEELEIVPYQSWELWGPVRAAVHNPDVVVRLGCRLGVLGVGLGALGVGLGILSLHPERMIKWVIVIVMGILTVGGMWACRGLKGR